jgi:hypothetical protein
VQTFLYQRHFILLAVAVVALAILSSFNFFSEALFPNFALNGALHAATLVLSLRTGATLVRKCLFVAIATLLSILTLYIGIVGLVLLAYLPGDTRLFAVLALCALAGGMTYGTLVRLFWVRHLSSRSVLFIAFICLFVTLPTYLLKHYLQIAGVWYLAAAWWFAFSAGLWYFDAKNTRGAAAPTR